MYNLEKGGCIDIDGFLTMDEAPFKGLNVKEEKTNEVVLKTLET